MRRLVRMGLALMLATAGCVHGDKDSGSKGKALARQAPGVSALGSKSAPAFQEIEFEATSDIGGTIGACKLSAVLALPAAPKALVVLVHGSGPINRDGFISGGYTPYKDIAQHLARADYATVRFDKRTSIASCAKKVNQEFSPSHFLDDLQAVIQAARARPETKDLPLVLIGHSKGATLTLELLARRSVDAHGVVLMAGLGKYPIDATILRQFRQALNDPELAEPTREAYANLLKDGEAYFFKIREGTASPNDFYMGAYSKFWREFVAMTDRTAAIAQELSVPALIIQGDQDKQVTREDFEALAEAMRANRATRSVWLKGVGHLFNREDDTRVAPEALEAIDTWLDELFGGTKV